MENEKRPIGKKIWSIALICVASILVVMMVLCYVIPKSFAPKIESPDFVKVYTETSQGKTYNKGSEVYDKIVALYSDSFKVTIMDALLTGNFASSGEYVEKHANPRSLNTNYIEFGYNGEEKTIADSGYQGSYQTYISVIVGVQNTKELTQTTVYYMTTSSASWVDYQTNAHQSALYEYILSI